MKTIRTYLLLFVFMVSAQAGFAGPSEATFRKLQESWTTAADGSQEYRCYKELTIHTHTAMNRTYGETFITYNPRHQQLKINASYTIQKDGTIVKTPANAFVEVLPKAAAGMPAYNHLKEMVVVHTGLELGATIVLDYSILSEPGYMPEIDVCRKLQQTSPVKEYRLEFTFPEDREAHYDLPATGLKPQESVSGGRKSLVWNFRDLPALSKAPGTALANGDVPGILFHTYPSAAAALQQVYARFDNPASLRSLSQEIAGDAQGEFARMSAIHRFVLSEIETCPLHQRNTAYRFRPAAEVIRTSYATELEKVNLLSGLLNAAGIKAVPFAAYAVDADPGCCALSGVEKWAVSAVIGNHCFRLDALGKGQAAADCRFMLALPDGKLTELGPESRTIALQASLRVSTGKAEGRISAVFSNSYLSNADIRSQDFLPTNRKDEPVHEPEGVKMSGELSVPLQETGGYLLLELPLPNVGIDREGYGRYNGSRSNNLLLPGLFDEGYVYTLQVDRDLELRTLPTTREIRNRAGSLSLSIKEEDGQVRVSRHLHLSGTLVTPALYSDFLELMKAWEGSRFRQLLFKPCK